jgi:Asp/Glu/hydantoin racemase
VEELLKQEPSLGAILVECTNLSPYSDALRKTFGLPVFDVIDLARLLHAAVGGQAFATYSGTAPR